MKINRREAMIGLGQLTLGAVALPSLLRAERAHASIRNPQSAIRNQKARSCIVVFLWGGPPHQDMFDMKTEAADGIRSKFKPISTNVPGIQVCEHMPLIAQQMDKVCVIRSVTHKSDNHEPSVYHMLTGYVDPTLVVPKNNRKRIHAPGIGAVISCLTESGNPLTPSLSRLRDVSIVDRFGGRERGQGEGVPGSVNLPRPIQHDGTKYAGTHAGWLGARYDPMELPDSPMVSGRPVLDFDFPQGVDQTRLVKRRGLLDLLETQDRYLQKHADVKSMDAFRERAWNMIASPTAKRAFNLELEDTKTRDLYGRSHYCETFLLARRLIEAGVRLVTINWMFFRPDGNPLNPWDNHGGTPALGSLSGYDMLKQDYCLGSFDRAYAALLQDLHQRRLLDETLVVCMGEFGRTPKINAAMGRDHWGSCGFATLAGAGVRGGSVYGASDKDGAYPTEKPVKPEDLLATVYGAFGISSDTIVHDLQNQPHRISEGEPITELFA